MSEGDQTLRAGLDEPLIIELEGIPSTGYGWADESADESARFVKVEICEWREKSGATKRARGQSKVFSCRVMPVKRGVAKITFLYRRPWEVDKPAKNIVVYNIEIE